MPYSNAFTMIDDLPPMIQMPIPNQQLAQYSNQYYEEIIKDHPTVQSKIRPTEVNPMARYEETIPYPINTVPSNPNYMIPDYPTIPRSPGSLRQDYIQSNMIPKAEEQHLPIVSNRIQPHYANPNYNNIQQNSYPIVESYLNCRDIKNHIDNCHLCNALYYREKIYMGVIGVLLILIFVLIFRFSK